MGVLENKVVAVTGAGRGIGRAIALDCRRGRAPRSSSPTSASASTAPSRRRDIADAVVAEIEDRRRRGVAVASDVGTMAGGESIVDRGDRHVGPHRRRRLRRRHPARADALQHVRGRVRRGRRASTSRARSRCSAPRPPSCASRSGGGILIGFTSRRVGARRRWRRPTTRRPRAASSASPTQPPSGLERYGVRANVHRAGRTHAHVAPTCPMQLAENGEPEDIAPMAVYLLVRSQPAHHRAGVHGRRQQDRRVEPADARSASMYSDGRWTPEEIAERLPATRRCRDGCRSRHGRGDAACRRRQGDKPNAMTPRRSRRRRRRRGLPGASPRLAGRPRRRRVRRAAGPRRTRRRGRRLRRAGRVGAGARRAGWIGLGWPVEHGGRGASLDQQIILPRSTRAPRRRAA